MKYSLQTQIFTLSLVVVFFTYSNGQTKECLLKDEVPIFIGQPKIIKTQGSTEYDNFHCGLQDKAGNLWFGSTREGVYCYDGKKFTQFTVKDGLSNNTVWSILEDKDGNIWFGTDDGVSCYNGKTITKMPIPLTNGSNLYPFTSQNNNPSIKNAVWSMMQDKSGKIWFGTAEGVYCYANKIFTRFLDNYLIINKNNLQLKMVDCIIEDKTGKVWFASGMTSSEGVCCFDGKALTNFKPNDNGWIRAIIEEENGNLLLDTRQYGVCRYDGKTVTNISEKGGINNASVWCILKDKAGNIWMGTELGSGQLGEDGGVWRFDGKTFTHFTTKDGLGHNGVSCIVEDKKGNIWFGTRNNGLSCYDGKTFTNF